MTGLRTAEAKPDLVVLLKDHFTGNRERILKWFLISKLLHRDPVSKCAFTRRESRRWRYCAAIRSHTPRAPHVYSDNRRRDDRHSNQHDCEHSSFTCLTPYFLRANRRNHCGWRRRALDLEFQIHALLQTTQIDQHVFRCLITLVRTLSNRLLNDAFQLRRCVAEF